MAAGTVISGGFPGRVAQEVQPNQKCGGCLHYDGQAGRTGACTIGLRPWLCGDGEAQDVGYAPLSRGAGSYLPDMGDHGAHAPEVDSQHVGVLYGSGSTRPVAVQQVALGEEHVHLVKSMVERHAELQKSQCRLCSMRGSHGVSPPNVGYQLCTCQPLEAAEVVKAIVGRMNNAQRARLVQDDGWVMGAADWVRDVAKAGFRLPAARAAAGEAPSGCVSIDDRVRIEDGGGHLRRVEKGTFYHASGKYDVSPAGGGKQHVNFTPRGGGEASHVGTFPSHGAARHALVEHAERLASGSGKVAPSTTAPTRKVRTPRADAASSAESDGGSIAKGGVMKAIDNARHSHVVTGKLAPHGVGASGREAAHAAADRLDSQYGASAHTVARNPNYKPKTLRWEKTSAYGPGGHKAEAGHGTYVHEPQPHGQHTVTYFPHGQGAEGAMHGGSHSSASAAHAAAQTHHQTMIGG